MIGNDDLDAAVTAGLLTSDQREKLTNFTDARRRAREASVGREERFIIANGLNEVFVALGAIVLGAGMLMSLNYQVRNFGLLTEQVFQNSMLLIAYAAVTWLAAEYLTRRKKMLAPSIVLATLFVTLVGFATANTFELVRPFFVEVDAPIDGVVRGIGYFLPVPPRAWMSQVFASAALVAAALHCFSFKLPFSLMLVGAGTAGTIISVVTGLFPGLSAALVFAIATLIGLAIFVAAMRNDLADPERLGVASDNAFWLHLAAAPLLVHSTIGLLSAVGLSKHNGTQPIAVLLIFALLALIALIVDRRAILVATLIYLGTTIAYLRRQLGVGTQQVVYVTPIILGMIVIVLGVGWQSLRTALWSILPTLGPVDILRPRKTK